MPFSEDARGHEAQIRWTLYHVNVLLRIGVDPGAVNASTPSMSNRLVRRCDHDGPRRA